MCVKGYLIFSVICSHLSNHLAKSMSLLCPLLPSPLQPTMSCVYSPLDMVDYWFYVTFVFHFAEMALKK